VFRIIPVEMVPGEAVETWPGVEDALCRAGDLCQQSRYRSAALVVIDDDGAPMGGKCDALSGWSDALLGVAMRRMRRDTQRARCGGRFDDEAA